VSFNQAQLHVELADLTFERRNVDLVLGSDAGLDLFLIQLAVDPPRGATFPFGTAPESAPLYVGQIRWQPVWIRRTGLCITPLIERCVWHGGFPDQGKS
jgi:hypothetical protein